MNQSQNKAFVLTTVVGALLFLGFQNCGKSFQVNAFSSTDTKALNEASPVRISFKEEAPNYDSFELLQSGEVNFAFEIKNETPESIQSVLCQWDSDPEVDCSSGVFKAKDVPDGDWDFKISLLTDSGRLVEVRKKVRIDSQFPVMQISQNPSGQTTSTTALFSFEPPAGSVDFARAECSLDGAEFSECKSTLEIKDLPLGDHVFRVRGISENGTIKSLARFIWKILPEGSSGMPEVPTNPPPVTPEAPPTDDDSGPTSPTEDPCKLDPSSIFKVAPCRSTTSRTAFFVFTMPPSAISARSRVLHPSRVIDVVSKGSFELKDLEVGTHFLIIHFYDKEGRPVGTSASYSWKVLEAAP